MHNISPCSHQPTWLKLDINSCSYMISVLILCKQIYRQVKYLANQSAIIVGVTLIWQKAEAAIHIIAMTLHWRHLNLADGREIAKPPN